ncbi:MAG: LON peptidase substrate-binding domain-containing protein [Planctomycetes bacterium]|nr:LON peptidase substrate-binding domain-containing protein [Planctomycetota bacterium]
MDVPDAVPMFPLPDHVLLLGLPTPYRIFEPRYRALVDDLLAREPRDRWLAVPRLAPGWQGAYHGQPAIQPVCTLGKVRNIRPLEDGQFLVIVEGLARCELSELPATSDWRMARPTVLDDLPGAESPEERSAAIRSVLALVNHLRNRLGDRGQVLAPLVQNTSDECALIDRLGAALLGDVEVRQSFLLARRLPERVDILRRGLVAVLERPQGTSRLRPPSTN